MLFAAEAASTQVDVRAGDLIAIVLYLLGMAAIGIYFSRKNTNTEEYFVGGRSFPGWVLGLSMLSTVISSVTFLAFPGDAYGGNWMKLIANLSLPVVAIFAIWLFIPFYRKANRTSCFEYLYARYGTPVRMYGVFSFLILQIWRLARILFLVALPINMLTGADLYWVIIITGIFIAFYTILGGIDAVIWTDAIQAVVLLLGGLVCIVYISFQLPGGFSQIIDTGIEHEKFYMGQFTPPDPVPVADSVPAEATQNFLNWIMSDNAVWAILFLGIFEWLLNYAGDQTVVQRYAAAKSLKDARKATILFSLLALPTWILFFMVGTSVYVFYQQFPDPGNPAYKPETKLVQVTDDSNTSGKIGSEAQDEGEEDSNKSEEDHSDKAFPYFILTQLPTGIAGIVIAGVLAAAMSSLDSSINSLSTVAVVDLIKPYFSKERDDKFYLRIAHGVAIFCALFMIIGAIYLVKLFESTGVKTMNDLTWILSSLFGGCMVGLFMVGFFTTRVDGRAATIGMCCAVLMNIYLGLNQMEILPSALSIPVHEYWIVAIVNATFVLIAFTLGSLRKTDQDLTDLTVWTFSEDKSAE